MNKLKEILFLKQLHGIGIVKINREYLKIIENAESIDFIAEQVMKIEKKYDELDILEAKNKAEEIYKELENRKDLHIITIFDDEYPLSLNDLKHNRPVVLYVKGNKNLLVNSFTQNCAVIGTRKPEEQSKLAIQRTVGRMIANYKESKEYETITIISGLALGCDAVAHQSALDHNGYTMAILPSGVDVITPVTNKKLAADIIEKNGCLISEYEPNVKVTKSSYVRRDALVAAMSSVLFVVECGVKSGTMHTVKTGINLERKIAVRYPEIQDAGQYEGNNYLLSNYDTIKITAGSQVCDLFRKDVEKVEESIKEEVIEQLTFANI